MCIFPYVASVYMVDDIQGFSIWTCLVLTAISASLCSSAILEVVQITVVAVNMGRLAEMQRKLLEVCSFHDCACQLR